MFFVDTLFKYYAKKLILYSLCGNQPHFNLGTRLLNGTCKAGNWTGISRF